MLCYYEEIGLIQSSRKEDYAYRVYDEEAMKRLQQIILLRKLQIPVKKIAIILDNPKASMVIDIFNANITEMEKEISAMTTIKTILETFVAEIEQIAAVHINLDTLTDNSVQKMADSLSLVQKNIKEKFNLDDLTRAADHLNKLKDVRIVYIPPMTVAAYHFIGEKSWNTASKVIDTFVSSSKLLDIKPDARQFKFRTDTGHPAEMKSSEVWVSIPDDMNVPEPMIKKRYDGGLFAVYFSSDMTFEKQLGFQDWINESSTYQYDPDDRYDMDETLNYSSHQLPGFAGQRDKLKPIKPYVLMEETHVELPELYEKCGYKVKLANMNKIKIIGFTQICTGEDKDFIAELKADGRMDIIEQYRKPGAPIVTSGMMDMDSQMRGGSRYSVCLRDCDITDIEAFVKHATFERIIDATKWLVFETKKNEEFDIWGVAAKTGYNWNNLISGHIETYPAQTIYPPNEGNVSDINELIYHWFAVK